MIDPMIVTVIISALVAALNPYSLGVLILLISVAYGGGRSSGHVFWLGIVYIATIFLLTFGGGLALLYLFSLMPLIAMGYLALGIGVLVVVAGLLEIKDFFWYGQGLSLRAPRIAVSAIRLLTKQYPGVGAAAMLGFFVALFNAPGTSAPYFATITLLHGGLDARAIYLLGLYAGIFVLPLVVLLGLVLAGVRVSTIQRWKEETKGKMRLGVGLLLVALGWTVMLVANGVLNLG